LFDLQLGPVALALCAAGSEKDQTQIDRVLELGGFDNFAANWLAFKGLEWAADLMSQQFNEEEYVPWLDAAE